MLVWFKMTPLTSLALWQGWLGGLGQQNPSFPGASLYCLSSRVFTLQHGGSGLHETQAEAASPFMGWKGIAVTYFLGQSHPVPARILGERKKTHS